MDYKYQLIKFIDGDFSLDVNVSPNEDTVWLTQDQIASLFGKARSTITEHINNIFTEKELDELTSVGFSDESVNHRPAKLYNLDVILAVGYRIKSSRGIKFRRWASSVLKEYLFKGYIINENRLFTCESNIKELANRVNKLEAGAINNSIAIYEGEIVEAYTFVRKIFFLAKNELIIIDKYADNYLLSMLKDVKVQITIYASSKAYINKLTIDSNIKIIHTDIFHDRFVIADEFVFKLGTSFNDFGKSRFIISKENDVTKEMLLRNIN